MKVDKDTPVVVRGFIEEGREDIVIDEYSLVVTIGAANEDKLLR